MRLTCSQKDLSNALSITTRAVGVSATLPVLNNVLIKAEGKKLYFTATNLEIAINHWIEADVKNEGEITLPSKLLTSYINYLKDEKVELSLEEGGGVLVKTSDSKTKIKGIAATEFPAIPVVEKEGGFSLAAKDFEAAIRQVAFSASLSSTRPILTGAYLGGSKDELKMVATDSYRLAEKTLKAKAVSGEISSIVPVKTLLELGGILSLSKEGGDVEVTLSKNQIHFVYQKTKITSRLIEGQFPNYQQVIPKASKTQVNLNVGELVLALKRIGLFAKENNNKILLKTDADGLKITTDATQLGVGEVEIKAKVEGDESEIALNSQFMLDMLGNLDSAEVSLKLGEKTQPALFQPAGKEDYVHIIMPLKI